MSQFQNSSFSQDEISLVDLFKLLLRYIWLIVSLTVIGGVVAFSVSAFILEPTYVASSTVFIRPRVNDGVISTGELAANARLANTYSEIARSNSVLRNVTVTGMSRSDIRDSITIQAVQNTEIMRFSSVTNSPQLSAMIANQVVSAFIAEIFEIIEIENLYIIDAAETYPNRIGPNVLLNTLIGIILGGMFSVGIVFIITMFDQTVSGRDQVEALLELPVIGEIRYIE